MSLFALGFLACSLVVPVIRLTELSEVLPPGSDVGGMVFELGDPPNAA